MWKKNLKQIYIENITYFINNLQWLTNVYSVELHDCHCGSVFSFPSCLFLILHNVGIDLYSKK